MLVNDAKRHGVIARRVDINRSQGKCVVEDSAILLGLNYVTGLGEAGTERVLRARPAGPFVDLGDFSRRTHLPRLLVGNLIRAGAFDDLGEQHQLLWQLCGRRYEEQILREEPEANVELPTLTPGEGIAWEYELLGLSPDAHPLQVLRPRLQATGVLTAAELEKQLGGKMVRVAGLVVVRQRPPTARGVFFVTLEDETGLANLGSSGPIVTQTIKLPFGRAYGLNDWEFVLATGVLQRQGSAVNVVVTHICPLTSTNLASVAGGPAHPLSC